MKKTIGETLSVWLGSSKTKGSSEASGTTKDITSGYASAKQMPIIGMLSAGNQVVFLFLMALLFLCLAFGSVWMQKDSVSSQTQSKSYMNSILITLIKKENLIDKFPDINSGWAKDVNENQKKLQQIFDNSVISGNFPNQKKNEIISQYQKVKPQVEELVGFNVSMLKVNGLINNSINRMNEIEPILARYSRNDSNLIGYHKNIVIALKDFYQHPSDSSEQINFNLNNLISLLNNRGGSSNSLVSAYSDLRQNNFNRINGLITPVQNVLEKKKILLDELKSVSDKAQQTIQAINEQPLSSEMSMSVYAFALVCFLIALWFIYCISLVYKVTFDNLKYILENRKAMIRKSIKIISEEAQLISGANFTRRISENGTELDLLSKELNKHIKLFQNKMIEMKKTIKVTDKAVRKTNVASSEYMDVSKNQIDSILKTVEEVFELTGKISEINRSSEELVRFSTQTSKVANQGVKASKDSNKAIVSVGSKIKEASEKTEKFQESSNKIKDVISMMKELAEQINVLSINASIQASKSGEAGKSFDVVAKGMQSLARRSAEAADHADVLIHNTLQNVDSVQLSVSSASEEINKSANLSIATQEALQDIVSFCSALNKNVTDINKKASEQASNAKKITDDTNVFLKNMEGYKESYQNFVKANEVTDQETKKLYSKAKEIRA